MKVRKNDISWAHGVRARGASRARKTHIVRRLTKAGVVTKAPITAVDWQYNAFDCAEKAEKRRLELERLNPGRRFMVVEL